jgi:hypothetical protein
VDHLAELGEQHHEASFPTAVTKGIDDGELDPVMIGECLSVRLTWSGSHRLATNSSDPSMRFLTARPYDVLVRIAELAVTTN